MLEKRVSPQNIEAEQAVLGARLIDLEQDADIVTFLYRRIIINQIRRISIQS